MYIEFGQLLEFLGIAIDGYRLDLALIPNPVEECLDVMPTGATSGSW
jgi:hypothetical protein